MDMASGICCHSVMVGYRPCGICCFGGLSVLMLDGALQRTVVTHFVPGARGGTAMELSQGRWRSQ